MPHQQLNFIQSQVNQLSQALDNVSRMAAQLAGSEQRNEFQLRQLQQNEVQATQQLRQLEQMCTQAAQQIRQISGYASQLSNQYLVPQFNQFGRQFGNQYGNQFGSTIGTSGLNSNLGAIGFGTAGFGGGSNYAGNYSPGVQNAEQWAQTHGTNVRWG